MSTELGFGALMDRLRANLRAAGVPAMEDDIQAIAERGFLRTVSAFEATADRIPSSQLPDNLAADAAGIPADRMGAETVAPPPAALRGHGGPRPGHGVPASNARAYAPIAAVAERVRSREVSPVELTASCLEAIAAHDPALNAFQVVLADRALAAARRAEEEIARGEYRGPLHGIPVAIKDLMLMAGTVTTGGSRILERWTTGASATVVDRLEAAGAIIVGKTRLPEFAYSPGSNNPHYGPTRNPWNPDHDTGGSSSGSGAAVAAGMVYGALGSDTGGSIRIPSAHCGIVGLKPTFGRISLHGLLPLSWSQDHPGPMARTVADATLLFLAVAGQDPHDPRSKAYPLPAYEECIGQPASGIAGLRIGVLGDDGSGRPLGTPEVLDAWHRGLAALERAGAALVEVDLPELADLRSVNDAILVLEAIAYHQSTLRERLDELGEFCRQRLLHGYAHGPGSYVRAQQARAALRRPCAAIFDRVDLLSTPTMPSPAPALGIPSPTTFMKPFNALGWPAITVPVGLSAERLPLGLQLAGRPWDEATVLRAAAALENSGPWRDLA